MFWVRAPLVMEKYGLYSLWKYGKCDSQTMIVSVDICGNQRMWRCNSSSRKGLGDVRPQRGATWLFPLSPSRGTRALLTGPLDARYNHNFIGQPIPQFNIVLRRLKTLVCCRTDVSQSNRSCTTPLSRGGWGNVFMKRVGSIAAEKKVRFTDQKNCCPRNTKLKKLQIWLVYQPL